MGEDPDAVAQEQAEGWGGEGGDEKVSIGRTSSQEAPTKLTRDKGPDEQAIEFFTAQILFSIGVS